MFATFEQYIDAFKKFIEAHDPNGEAYYFEGDENLQRLVCENYLVLMLRYGSLTRYQDVFIYYEGNAFPFPLIERHNVQNAGGAWCIFKELGISFSDFLKAMSTFRGVKKITIDS